MKIRKFILKNVAIMLLTGAVSTFCITASAVETDSQPANEIQNIQEDTLYYDEISLDDLSNEDINKAINEMNLEDEDDSEISVERFKYRYRFRVTSQGIVYGKAKRISNYYSNKTSKTQEVDLSGETKESWSINTTLTGKYKKAFEAVVGGEWNNTRTFSETFHIRLAPNKKVWLEFKPLYNYKRGYVEKYFITRGPLKQEVVETSKKIYTKSPKKLTKKINGKKCSGPDGEYTFREAKC